MNEQEGQGASRERARSVVETICREIEASRGTRIWDGFVNSLNLISQVVFTRSSGCVLELVQNAEDAGRAVASPGEFAATIDPKRLKVTHNAQPFSETNVNAICDIRSSKKPELNTLGYLGIGFKSVFKVTDSPEIHSGSFHFKFDLQHWPNPTSTPWRIMPIWVDQPSEEVEPDKTTFIFPLRDGGIYRAVLDDLKQLGIEPFLFLHWLRKIVVIDEAGDQRWSVESGGEEHGVTKFLQNGHEHRFKIFRRTVQAPEWVRAID